MQYQRIFQSTKLTNVVSKRLDQGLIFVVRRDIRVINDRWSEAIAKPKIYKNRQNVRSLLSRRKPRDK